jgi:hypothetical protein
VFDPGYMLFPSPWCWACFLFSYLILHRGRLVCAAGLRTPQPLYYRISDE